MFINQLSTEQIADKRFRPGFEAGAFCLNRPADNVGLVFPESSEAIRRQGRIALRADDRPVPQIALDRAGVMPVIGKLIAGRVPQHVAVDQERELSGLAGPRDRALIARDAQGAPRSLTNT